MASRFGETGQPDLDRLLSILNTSGLQMKDQPLYQVIKQLIEAVRQFQSITNASITGSGNIVTGLENADFLTHADDSVLLPNSRQLIAGTNVSFDDTIVNQRVINATSSGSSNDYVVMSDGVIPIPAPVDDGFGNFIYIMYTP